jgi:uncharacterized protein (DUF305 family)
MKHSQTETQYKLGMIPHHSMAVHMSKKLLEKENNISPFVENIIKTQEDEINYLKKLVFQLRKGVWYSRNSGIPGICD